MVMFRLINITDNRHFAFVYLLGKLDNSLYSQWNKICLFIYTESDLFITS